MAIGVVLRPNSCLAGVLASGCSIGGSGLGSTVPRSWADARLPAAISRAALYASREASFDMCQIYPRPKGRAIMRQIMLGPHCDVKGTADFMHLFQGVCALLVTEPCETLTRDGRISLSEGIDASRFRRGRLGGLWLCRPCFVYVICGLRTGRCGDCHRQGGPAHGRDRRRQAG